MKYISFFGFMSLCIFFIYRIFATSTDDHTLERVLAKDPVIVDVRTPAEFKMGHLEGAVNIPLNELQSGKTFDLDRTRPILTCCSQGVRSAQAVDLLHQRGYKEVTNGGSWVNLEMTIDKYQSGFSDAK